MRPENEALFFSAFFIFASNVDANFSVVFFRVFVKAIMNIKKSLEINLEHNRIQKVMPHSKFINGLYESRTAADEICRVSIPF